jgi:SsrA-binding protein
MTDDGIKVVATNRKARHEYHIDETLEAGIVLTGTEIKSIRAGHISLQEAYVVNREGEMWIVNMHISPYDPGHREQHEPLRPRKLLMHRRQIAKWTDDLQRKGLTIIPLRLYLKKGRAKLEIALAKGKKLYDKRQDLAAKDAKRRIDRALNERN